MACALVEREERKIVLRKDAEKLVQRTSEVDVVSSELALKLMKHLFERYPIMLIFKNLMSFCPNE